jgi:hypothetical protein
MNKHYYSPLALIKIATQHAYAAESLLQEHSYVHGSEHDTKDVFLPAISMIYIAFQLTLKAYLAHIHRPVKTYKTLMELLELNEDLSFSPQDKQLIKTLARQLSFHKGVDPELWETPQEQEVFFANILMVYERLQEMMPLELQEDYL